MEPGIHLTHAVVFNALGHAAGVLVFAVFTYYYLRDRHGRASGGSLPVWAAGLALIWNLGSLVALAPGIAAGAAGAVMTASFCSLSFLPAVLLHIFLERRSRPVWVLGYAVSAAAMILHASELFRPGARRHDTALLAITIGFGLLAPLAALPRAGRTRPLGVRGGSRLIATMCLVLLATSFVHFGAHHVHGAWPAEVLIHHIGIPLALLVLLQNFRFLLLDAFLLVVANGVLAAVFTAAALAIERRYSLLASAVGDPFVQAMVVLGISLLLIAFARGATLTHSWLERLLFRRGDVPGAAARLASLAAASRNEGEFVQAAAEVIAGFASANRFVQRPSEALEAQRGPTAPEVVADGCVFLTREEVAWAQAVVPLRFSRGDGRFFLFGRRTGGLRYLSGDLSALERLAATVTERVEQLRESELKRLVSESELRALQSQINPHFLFNALNAVYGTIPKSARQARQAVLNLSEIFRYRLRSTAALVPVAEEIEIVQAYLELESLRLGPRLHSEIEIDDSARDLRVPALSIQPLVENAVKHGIAPKAGPGTVRVAVRHLGPLVRVEVTDTGPGFRSGEPDGAEQGAGVGLSNVGQRLRLCFGPDYDVRVASTPGATRVGFDVPAVPAPVRA